MDNIIGSAIYYLCAAFFMRILLQVDLSNKKKLVLSLISFIIGFAVVIALCTITVEYSILNLSPIVILLPLYITFWFISAHRGLKLLFVLLTASILMLLPMLLGVAVSCVINNEMVMTVASLMVIAGTIVLLIKFFRPQFIFILQYVDSKGYWLSICVIPILYNISVYMIGLYNMKSAHGFPLFFQVLLMGITLSAYILIVLTFVQIKKRMETEYSRNLTEIQIEAAIENIERLQEAQNQTAIYRHDMRHHIQMINSYLNNGECDKISTYMKGLENELDELTLTEYCKNHILNLILSIYAKKAIEAGAKFIVTANIPETIDISEKDICVILSNALENAVNAVKKVEMDNERIISFECKIKNNKLVFIIKNTYSGAIEFDHGLPKSNKINHGFGTQSIAAIATRNGGLYSFEADENLFYFKLII